MLNSHSKWGYATLKIDVNIKSRDLTFFAITSDSPSLQFYLIKFSNFKPELKFWFFKVDQILAINKITQNTALLKLQDNKSNNLSNRTIEWCGEWCCEAATKKPQVSTISISLDFERGVGQVKQILFIQ